MNLDKRTAWMLVLADGLIATGLLTGLAALLFHLIGQTQC